jgi:hypothetical protein
MPMVLPGDRREAASSSFDDAAVKVEGTVTTGMILAMSGRR